MTALHSQQHLQSPHTSITVASQQSSADEAETEYLPYPATKLIIGQYWHCSRDPPFWGWLIVGTFYDQHNNPVWSTEIFAFQRDTRGDDTESSSVVSSDSDSSSEQDLASQFSNSLSFDETNNFTTPTNRTHQHPHYNRLWDPSVAGPVPGSWITAYDPHLGNWVNTWQPNHHHF
ncbi:hypothetical protein CkaCkLH20_11255 [Colletotrichum karsti]|uniref:Uncharacterized protein n=1 Tax=Colletotrichum karsti TaxID=1095194 RepID=A0A9P6LDB9_9PEZI|nr:uncharacterized protein CkaCkLH20_11255 [Colletotrichum karsti]KAF9871334.1 hypothetical protein CkaCkLH20_11255 [Colletotrichum karsti]